MDFIRLTKNLRFLSLWCHCTMCGSMWFAHVRYYNSTKGETVLKFSRIFEMCVSWVCSAERMLASACQNSCCKSVLFRFSFDIPNQCSIVYIISVQNAFMRIFPSNLHVQVNKIHVSECDDAGTVLSDLFRGVYRNCIAIEIDNNNGGSRR